MVSGPRNAGVAVSDSGTGRIDEFEAGTLGPARKGGIDHAGADHQALAIDQPAKARLHASRFGRVGSLVPSDMRKDFSERPERD